MGESEIRVMFLQQEGITFATCVNCEIIINGDNVTLSGRNQQGTLAFHPGTFFDPEKDLTVLYREGIERIDFSFQVDRLESARLIEFEEGQAESMLTHRK